ncbi:MAG: signal peptidase I [Lachnospiraceae bacterium]|nr:signal peptidase I [Lachnospiraceae bacterium]
MSDSDAMRQPEEEISAGSGGDTSGFEAIAEQVRAEQKNSRRKRVLTLLDTLLICALAALIAILIRAFVITPLKIDGDSMENVLSDGDVVLLSKISVKNRDPKRYEIVVAEKPDGGSVVKRVIGLPGEVLYTDESGLIHVFKKDRSGELAEEVELEAKYAYSVSFRGLLGTKDNPMVLVEDEFCLLGDNRTVSKDSRFYGPFSKDSLKGIAVYRILPLGRFGTIG